MDTTKKFNGYAKDYTIGRPSYAKELIDCLYDNYGISKSSRIADIGSGTGKFARHLLDRGSEVYCVEPNDDMRNAAEKELGSYIYFHSIAGGAENTSLANGFVDFITTAQAFHWFDIKKFKQECKRILKKDGMVFLIWNIRDETDSINQEIQHVYTKFCPNFKGFNGGIKKDDLRIREFFEDHYDYVSFDHPLFVDREKYISRSLSGSYSLKEGEKDFNEYMKALVDVFEKYADNETVSIANKSVAYIGRM